MKKRFIVIGNGWLGSMIIADLRQDGHEVLVVKTQEEALHNLPHYDTLINAAAKTNIDWCEKNKLECFMANVDLATELADACYAQGKRYVFISSACIFESRDENDWKDENSQPNPGCFYALTKWMAEELIQSINPFTLIVRIRLPLSEVPHPRNTINKLLTYDYVQTNQESVTVVEDFIPAFRFLVNSDAKGIYHLINEGTISPSEVMDAFGKLHNPVSKKDMDLKMKWEDRAHRVTTLVKSTKIPMLPNVRERLPSLVENYKNASK